MNWTLRGLLCRRGKCVHLLEAVRQWDQVWGSSFQVKRVCGRVMPPVQGPPHRGCSTACLEVPVAPPLIRPSCPQPPSPLPLTLLLQAQILSAGSDPVSLP